MWTRGLSVPARWLAAWCGVMIVLCVGHVANARADASTAAPAISVVGNQLESDGTPVQLRGVDTNAYNECGGGDTFYDTTFPDDPDDDFADQPVNQYSVDVMRSWGINSVRVALNESCWLGQPTAPDGSPTSATLPDRCASYTTPEVCETAASYQRAVENYVKLLSANGLYVTLELQETAPPGFAASAGVDYFPDAANAVPFWREVAAAFYDEPNVLFDLDGEWAASPYGGPDYTAGTYGYSADNAGENWTDDDIWNCWLQGCDDVPSLYGGTYDTAGVQPLINTIRDAGATNPIVLGTPDYTLGYNEQDCGDDGATPCWQAYEPDDPAGQLVYDAHVYDFDFGPITTDPDGDADPTAGEEDNAVANVQDLIQYLLAPVARQYPVMFGELGEATCQDPDAPFVPAALADIDQAPAQDGVTFSVYAWTWDTDDDNGDQIGSGWQCPTGEYGNGGPLLITDYDGAATAMGQVFKHWFQAKDPGYPAPPASPLEPSGTTTTGTASGAPTSNPPAGPSAPPTQASPGNSGAATGTGSGAAPPVAPASVEPGKPTAPAPRVRVVPHITTSGTSLDCSGGSFTGAGSDRASFAWFNVLSGARIGGPSSARLLARTRVLGQVVQCAETVGSTVARSRLLPVPGAITTTAGGSARLAVSCPAVSRTGCTVTLSLTGSHGRRLGSARLTLRTGFGSVARVRLSPAGRRLLTREKRLSVNLTVTETVAGAKQTTARARLAFRA